MAQDHSVTDRVHAAVRVQLVDGAIAPGARVDAVRLAAIHHTSPTPVREALARLLGEGFLEFAPRRGYSAPALTRGALQDLYDWSALLSEAVVRRSGPMTRLAPDAPAGTAQDYVARVARIGLALMDTAPMPQTRAALSVVQERLHFARLSEVAVISGALEEVVRLRAALYAQRGAIAALRRFHRRRRDQAGAIVGHMLARLANGDHGAT